MDYYIYYGLTILAFIITSLAQAFVMSTYKKYSSVKVRKNITGREAARIILDKNDLKDVDVEEVKGYLSDHYDPSKKVVRLSSSNYNGSSIASVSVASHECGHAIQDKVGYTFMRFRSSLVPIVNFSSYTGYIAIVIGLLLSSTKVIFIGIALELVILLFQIVTLPVEIDASKRALKEIDKLSFLEGDEYKSGKVVLIAAALTYVASVAAALLEILRLVLIFGKKNR